MKEKEKIKAEFTDFLNELNIVGDIDYATYSSLLDESHRLFDEMYELGKSLQVPTQPSDR